MRFSRVAAASLLLVSCTPPPPAGAPLAPKLIASAWKLPAGAHLISACTPAAQELCFNAKDDNCNGVIDEGCGEETGPLQFVLAWSDATVDLDLAVTLPSGAAVSKRARATASGFLFTKDCPTESCGGQNVESIHLEEGGASPFGHYKVHAGAAEGVPIAAPVPAVLGLRLGRDVVTVELLVGSRPESGDVEFDLSSAPESRF